VPLGVDFGKSNWVKLFLGFCGFWPRSLGLKEDKFLGSFSAPSIHLNFKKVVAYGQHNVDWCNNWATFFSTIFLPGFGIYCPFRQAQVHHSIIYCI